MPKSQNWVSKPKVSLSPNCKAWLTNEFFYLLNFILFMYLFTYLFIFSPFPFSSLVYLCMCHSAHEEVKWHLESVLHFHPVNPGNQIQLVSLGGKHPYPQIHLTCPRSKVCSTNIHWYECYIQWPCFGEFGCGSMTEILPRMLKDSSVIHNGNIFKDSFVHCCPKIFLNFSQNQFRSPFSTERMDVTVLK